MSGKISTNNYAGVPYSAFARLLPYIEQTALAQQVNLLGSAADQPAVVSQRIPLFLCPSEPNDGPSLTNPLYYPANYGVGLGDWFAANEINGQGGNGTFPFVGYPTQLGVRLADITDGLSMTVGMAEVKANGPWLDYTAGLGPNVGIPASPPELVSLGGQFNANTAHVSWALAFSPTTGLSFVFPPNTIIPYVSQTDGKTFDVDWAGGGGSFQFAAMVARSYHVGGVNGLLMDGSVRFVISSISQPTWRTLGTRSGGEVINEF